MEGKGLQGLAETGITGKQLLTAVNWKVAMCCCMEAGIISTFMYVRISPDYGYCKVGFGCAQPEKKMHVMSKVNCMCYTRGA